MMKVYLAAPYGLRDALRDFAVKLNDSGMECTSSWLEGEHELAPQHLGTSPASSDEYARHHVKKDIEDVLRSDALVLFTWRTSEIIAEELGLQLGPNSGGRHVETGVALGAKIPVLVYSRAENIFHRGDGCYVCPSWQDIIRRLSIIKEF